MFVLSLCSVHFYSICFFSVASDLACCLEGLQRASLKRMMRLGPLGLFALACKWSQHLRPSNLLFLVFVVPVVAGQLVSKPEAGERLFSWLGDVQIGAAREALVLIRCALCASARERARLFICIASAPISSSPNERSLGSSSAELPAPSPEPIDHLPPRQSARMPIIIATRQFVSIQLLSWLALAATAAANCCSPPSAATSSFF